MTRHDAEVLQEYAGDLMKRNGPHASQIKGVARALPGGVILAPAGRQIWLRSNKNAGLAAKSAWSRLALYWQSEV
jgi:hypothetical protein